MRVGEIAEFSISPELTRGRLRAQQLAHALKFKIYRAGPNVLERFDTCGSVLLDLSLLIKARVWNS